MDWFEAVPDFDPDWMSDIEEDERRAQRTREQVEVMPHPNDFDCEENWEEAVEQFEFEETMTLLTDMKD